MPLDRETTDSYKLTVIAEDKGVSSLSTNVSVHINVSDVNDNMPHFSKEHYTVSLDENGLNDVFLNLTVSVILFYCIAFRSISFSSLLFSSLLFSSLLFSSLLFSSQTSRLKLLFSSLLFSNFSSQTSLLKLLSNNVTK